MREIKFRAWHSTFVKMLDDDEWHHYSGAQIIKGKLTSMDRVTLMQYTGLKDKNGKEIYEGDLLHNPNDENYCYPVIWNEDKAGFGLGTDDENLRPYQVHEFWEIIGNIYENPELLDE